MKKKIKAKPKIEFQEIEVETGRRSYEIFRISRLKYVGNQHIFLDLWIFQRGYDSQVDDEVYFPTKYRVQFKEEQAELYGGKATIEERIPRSLESVDVGLRKDEMRVALEISTISKPDQEIQNIRKCLEAGYDYVI